MRVATVDADIYHYGWVRPPSLMMRKSSCMRSIYSGHNADGSSASNTEAETAFDYGPMENLAVFHGTHPSVMEAWIRRMDWKDQLRDTGNQRTTHAHDRLKYRILTFIEQRLFGGRVRLAARRYRLLRR
jgi:hypothetical protein